MAEIHPRHYEFLNFFNHCLGALLQQLYVTFFFPSFEPLKLNHVDLLLLVVVVAEKDRIHV